AAEVVPQAQVETGHASSVAAAGIPPTVANFPPPPLDADAEHEPEIIAGLRSKEPAALPQSKSVRIALERLDSMMNAVGELVINRTRMLGRLAELERLAEILTFSKGRMQDKIGGFQEKYEYSSLKT